MSSAQQTASTPDDAGSTDQASDIKHTYVDQVRVRYGFGVILCAFVLVAFTVIISVYFFFTSNEAVAVISTVTGMIMSIVSTWFGISSANSVATRALSGQPQQAGSTAATAPSVAGIAPQSGPAGTEVTLSGKGFTGATAVTFGGIASPDFKVVSDTSITADVPEGKNPASVSNVDVIVVGPAGALSAANPNAKFTFRGIGVGRLIPNRGKANEIVTVLGSGFRSGTTYSVTFTAGGTGTPATGVTFVDETTLHAAVPNLGTACIPCIVAVADAKPPATASATHAQAVFIFDP